FCTNEQVETEVLRAVEVILGIYETFEFGGVEIAVGTRPDKRVGSDDQWDVAEEALQQALRHRDLEFALNPGDGAFYGPKIDFRVSDAIGRPWQLGTVQLDYQMPGRFGLSYVGADGEEHRPVMIHRAMLGSIERFIGILIEHTAGAFAPWLAPLQAVVIPVSEKFHDYGSAVKTQLAARGLRVEEDLRNEKLGYKIRQAQIQKVPYMLVVGGREEEAGTVALRLRTGEDLGARTVDEVGERIEERVRGRRSEL
ncbi:MAG TPA: threonine--tRNA ligase, partial [Thermoanaerobaculia bacterium]|nr:threonine--tRNA ligase [Thermoanaerobaculia bacterium]